jgi:hypothetical protein
MLLSVFILYKSAIDNEDFSEISDHSGITYSILKINPKSGSSIKIKKNVIYNLYGSCFSLGGFTKIILYNEREYFILKEKEKNDFLFSIYNEVSLSIVKEDDQLSKKVFSLIENNTIQLEKNNLLSLCDYENISSIFKQTEDRKISKDNHPSNDVSMNENNREIQIIDITSNLTKNIKKKTNTSKKNSLLNQIDLKVIKDNTSNSTTTKKTRRANKLSEMRETNHTESEKEIRRSKLNNSPNNTVDSEENEEGNEVKRSSKLTKKTAKKKRMVGWRELNGMVQVTEDLQKRPLINLKQSEEIFKNIKKLKPFQNKRIYLHNNTPDAVKNLIETSGGKLINNVENCDCIVICEKSNQKLISSMKKKGIICYSKQSILDALKNEKTLELEKYTKIYIGMLFKVDTKKCKSV